MAMHAGPIKFFLSSCGERGPSRCFLQTFTSKTHLKKRKGVALLDVEEDAISDDANEYSDEKPRSVAKAQKLSKKVILESDGPSAEPTPKTFSKRGASSKNKKDDNVQISTSHDNVKMSTPPHDKHSANTPKPFDALEHVYCSYFKNSRNKSCHNLARWCQSARAKFPEFCKTHKLNTHTFDWFAGRGGVRF